jgi:hypothetical protein
MPVRISATTAASLNGCGGPWWDVSRRASNLMEVILGTYYKCTLSAISRKLNASRHMLIWTLFPSPPNVELVPKICPHLSVIICTPITSGARDSVVGWGTMLEAGRSGVQSPMLLEFSIHLILPAALCPWDRLSL